MRRPVMIGGIALALLVTAVTPAHADSPQRQATAKGRFTHLNPTSVGRIVNLPAGLRKDVPVNALVELSSAPVAVQEAATGGKADSAAVLRQVSAEQAGKDAALRAAGATVEGRLTHVLNAVRIRVRPGDLGKVAAIPGVKQVQVSTTVRLDNGAGGAYTGVGNAWQDLKLTGAGTVIGVIDTGIDYTHADFGGPGTVAAYDAARAIPPGQTPPGNVFPTAKVIGGYDFVGDAYNSDDTANNTPHPDVNPIPCQDHGTHVAGTAAGAGVSADGTTYAGPYGAATLPGTFMVAPGTAPQAKLRAYKVFGCDGTVSDDIVVAAIDRAVADGVDVINMSLGETFGEAGSLDARAVDNASAAGVVVVASAGNDGANAYVTGSPAAANSAISVAAMDASSPTFPGADLAIAGGSTVKAQNSNGAPIAAFTADVVVATDAAHLGCALGDYAGAEGKIVITVRGICDRVERAKLGQKAKAKAVVMINSGAGLPPFEGPIDTVTIPFLGVDASDSAAVAALLAAKSVSVSPASIANPGYTHLADFSSAGPRRGDSALKPDLAAPGVSVVSAGMGRGTGSLTMSGTSMASPHTTGIAALVRQAHPSWTPLQVKAAMVSTADPGRLGDYAAAGGVTRAGTGLVQPRRAADTVAYAWTPDGQDNLSFGLVTVRTGDVESRTYRIANTSARPITYDLSTQLSTPSYGSLLRVSPSVLTVPARSSKSVTLTISLSATAAAGLPGADASNDGALVQLGGAVVATPRGSGAGVYPLRTGFLMVPKAGSDVRAEGDVRPGRAATVSGKLSLTNGGSHAGTGDVYAWEISDPARDTTDPEVPDIVDAGVQTLPGASGGLPDADRLLVFAVNANRATSTHATQEIDVVIDTNGDGVADFITFVADHGVVTAGAPDGSLDVFTLDVSTPTPVIVDVWGAYAPANTSIEELPVRASILGLADGHGSFTFTVTGYSALNPADSDSTGQATFDAYHPAVATGGFVTVAPHGKATVPVTVDTLQLPAQTVKGWLVVTGDDAPGRPSADRVPLHLG